MIQNNKTVVFTTIYPKILPFISDFFHSLEKQSYKQFDVIVLNDGIENFCSIKNQYDLNIIEVQHQSFPAENREVGINSIKMRNYEYLIFCDADDYIENNRIEINTNLLRKNDIICNDINLVDKRRNCIKQNLLAEFMGDTYYTTNEILSKNYLGFTNTAIKTSLLKNIDIEFNNEIIAVDWYFFTILLLQNPNAKIYFTNKTSTYYRQYEQNTIGINNTVNVDKIKLGIKVKLIHYKSLINFCKENQISNFTDTFEAKYQDIKKIKSKIEDKTFLKEYISVIKNNFDIIFKGWWSEIITFKEFEYYENKINKK